MQKVSKICKLCGYPRKRSAIDPQPCKFESNLPPHGTKTVVCAGVREVLCCLPPTFATSCVACLLPSRILVWPAYPRRLLCDPTITRANLAKLHPHTRKVCEGTCVNMPLHKKISCHFICFLCVTKLSSLCI